ncbi:hypothetical protein [Streptomyces sp. NPDC057403]|uniref:hypothetical protein n=1 Tax=Streptomyces sp. NPDC057403 TaxID=3346119 RepID=UPI0036990AAB
MVEESVCPSTACTSSPVRASCCTPAGITEAHNADRHQFGEEGRIDALRTHHGGLRTAQTVIDTVTTAVRDFAGPHDGADDQAALALTARPQ